MRPLIFDLDDTLIESFPTYVRVHQEVAHDLGWPVPSRDALVAYGRSWRATLAELWPDRDLDRFVRRYDELADRNPYPQVPGASSALGELRERGHELWIVTKRSGKRLHQRMEEAGLDRDLFRGIFPQECQPASKPDPRCFAPVWEAIGGPASTALYVGDRADDAHAAHAAGIGFVGIRSGPEGDGVVPPRTPAEAVLQSVAELPGWLAALAPGPK